MAAGAKTSSEESPSLPYWFAERSQVTGWKQQHVSQWEEQLSINSYFFFWRIKGLIPCLVFSPYRSAIGPWTLGNTKDFPGKPQQLLQRKGAAVLFTRHHRIFLETGWKGNTFLPKQCSGENALIEKEWTALDLCMTRNKTQFRVLSVAATKIWKRTPSQRPHFTWDGHTKPMLQEVKDQVLLGQTGLVQ